MAGESIVVYGITVNAVTSGASVINTAFSVAPTSSVVGSHVLADAVLSGTFAVAPVASQSVHLYRRDMNIKGVSAAPAPLASNKNIYVGSFILSTDVTQTINLPAIPLSPDCEFYIENDSGQTLNAGWTLDIKPFGYGIAP